MKSRTFRFQDDIMDWLINQSKANHRSTNLHLEYLLSQLKKEDDKSRYQLGINLLCRNGTHYFASSNPAMNEFCNCRMYVYGEVVR